MSEERLQILRMLADKTISVDDAERLLRAVEAGDAPAPQAPPRKGAGPFGFGIEQIGATINSMGEAIEDVMGDALEGLGLEGVSGQDSSDVPLEDGGFAIPAGSKLVLRNRKGGATSLVLSGAEGERCTVNPDAVGLRVRKLGGRVLVLWDDGDLRISVPPTVASIKARLMGGGMKAQRVPCPVELKTMGGDLELRELRHSFDVKTMGGAIAASLDASFTGRGRAVTMGGDVQAVVPAGIKVAAQTMGGTVEVDAALGQAVRHGSGGGQRVEVGPPHAGAATLVELKTMGGNVRLQSAAG